jgi:tetratricopeptide (TPR) repeat protein
MKNQLSVFTIAVLSTTSFSQTLQESITKTDNENFENAAASFRTLIAKEPTNGTNYFYLGENYFKRGDADSANVFYAKGAELNATNPLNYIGLGKVFLSKGNVTDAKSQFFKGVSLAANKNAEVLRKNAEAWLVTDAKNADEAIALANSALKLEPKNPENFILLGDAQLEKNPSDGSGPIKSYKSATTLNPKSARGILREGKLYQRGRNYQLAIDKYKEAISIDPTFAPAYRELAEVYSLYTQYSKAIENWKKYLELNNSDFARYRFMSALFANKQYQEAITEYEGLKKQNYKSLYLERLAGYSYYEIGIKNDPNAYTKGLTAMDAFFKMAPSDFKYLYNDYKYKGLLLSKTGKDSLGLIELEKAITLDAKASNEILSDIAAIYMKLKKYDKAIINYERKMNGEPKNLNNNDYFGLGKSYFYTGINLLKESNTLLEAIRKSKKSSDINEASLKEKEAAGFFVKADTSFSRLTTLSPVWPIGYFWRGRSNSYLDPKNEKWLAKPHYEKMLTLIKPEERTSTYKSNVIEASEYLGDYYLNNKEFKDKTKADEYWSAVKELDPANEKAKYYFAPPKPIAPKGTKPKGKN